MSNGKSNGTGPRHSGSNGSAAGSAHPNGQVGSLNCAEFFRNPYGMYEDESIETAIEARCGSSDSFTNSQIPNLRIFFTMFIMISFLTDKLRKKPVLDQRIFFFFGWEQFLQSFCWSTSAYKSYHKWRSHEWYDICTSAPAKALQKLSPSRKAILK